MTENNSGFTEESVSSSAQAGGSDRSVARGTCFLGRFRWVICAVLFIGISKNYMDRSVLGVLKVTLQHDLGWNEIDYGHLVFAFQAAYAVGMLALFGVSVQTGIIMLECIN